MMCPVLYERKRQHFSILHVMYGIAMALLWVSCSHTQKQNNTKSGSDQALPIIEAQHTDSQFSEMGRLRMRIQAPRQQEYGNGDIRFPAGVFIIHYDEEGLKTALLEADSGFYFSKEGIYEARGSVLLKNLSENSSLSTEKLTWNPQTQRVYTDKYVRIESEDEIHTGEGLNASEDFEDYRILKPSGTLEIDETLGS